jgi:hypothetical protein
MNVVTVIGVLVLLAIVVIAAAWWYTQQQRRSKQLRQRFGPEYERAVDQYGERGRAEEALTARTERVEQLHIRPLRAEDSARYAESWRSVQSRFVDDPEGAIGEADRLCGEVMQARGYPMGNFEQRAADISVDHPQVVEHYRAAHEVARRSADGNATTEDLRQAMVHYRTLFEDLIETREPARVERTQ